jgi:AraC family transcriptional regulator
MKARAGRRRWSGAFVVDHGCALYLGPAFETTVHAHHAIQICVGLEGAVRLRRGPGVPWTSYDGAVVGADTPHELAADGRAVALLYLEPESPEGWRLRVGGFTRLEPARVAAVRRLGRARDLDSMRDALGLASVSAVPLDARIGAALRVLHASSSDRLRSAELARRVGLSAGRFRHLFLREVGLGYRRYLLWLRLRSALEALHRSGSLTTAAHAAGFADSAHLTRTTRRMFGIVPSAMPG